MTNLKNLMMTMKSSALNATSGSWNYKRSGFNAIVQARADLSRGGPATVVLCKLFRSEWRGELKTANDAIYIASASPSNVLTLIDALQKALDRVAELESNNMSGEEQK